MTQYWPPSAWLTRKGWLLLWSFIAIHLPEFYIWLWASPDVLTTYPLLDRYTQWLAQYAPVVTRFDDISQSPEVHRLALSVGLSMVLIKVCWCFLLFRHEKEFIYTSGVVQTPMSPGGQKKTSVHFQLVLAILLAFGFTLFLPNYGGNVEPNASSPSDANYRMITNGGLGAAYIWGLLTTIVLSSVVALLFFILKDYYDAYRLQRNHKVA